MATNSSDSVVCGINDISLQISSVYDNWILRCGACLRISYNQINCDINFCGSSIAKYYGRYSITAQPVQAIMPRAVAGIVIVCTPNEQITVVWLFLTSCRI